MDAKSSFIEDVNKIVESSKIKSRPHPKQYNNNVQIHLRPATVGFKRI